MNKIRTHFEHSHQSNLQKLAEVLETTHQLQRSHDRFIAKMQFWQKQTLDTCECINEFRRVCVNRIKQHVNAADQRQLQLAPGNFVRSALGASSAGLCVN